MPPPQDAWNPVQGPGDYTTTKEVHSDTYPGIEPTKANLSGKAVFVSGGSRGIGRAIAVAFARGGASQIAIGARSSLAEAAEEIKKAAVTAGRKEPQILQIHLEVTDAESVKNAAQEIERTFGRLDVVVNNAGILGERALVADGDVDAWWQTMNVNLRGPYLIARACLPLLLKSELKTVITVSSVGAHCTSPTLSAYQTSKLAVLRLTEFIGTEYAEQGIIAFTVHPGNILTDIVSHGEGMDDKLKAIFTETPELCADTLVYLSKERREWLNKRYINVTWDMPELTSPALREKIVEGDLLRVRLAIP